MLKQTKDGLLIHLKIMPNSSRNEIIKSAGGIKSKLTAQPIDGKANKALIEYLSKELKVPKSCMEIIKGYTSKEKTILLKVFDEEKVKFLEDKLFE